jgi:mRNA interferase RelE/StbE
VAKYSLTITLSARRELDMIDNVVFARIDQKIIGLAENPRPPGCKKLRGYKDQWRIRIGDWRVIYRIDDSNMLVNVTRVAHRREVYER